MRAPQPARSLSLAITLGLSLCACREREKAPLACSSAACVADGVALELAQATPRLGDAGRVVLVEEGEHGTALVGTVVSQGEERLLVVAMVPVPSLFDRDLRLPLAPTLAPGKAIARPLGERRDLSSGQLALSITPGQRSLTASLTTNDGKTATAEGRYRLECHVPGSVLNVQHRGVAAPGSETYVDDQGFDSEFCRRARPMR